MLEEAKERRLGVKKLCRVGAGSLTPSLDRFLERNRIAAVATTLSVVALASPLLSYLPFDFPLHLHNLKTESVATYLEHVRSDIPVLLAPR